MSLSQGKIVFILSGPMPSQGQGARKLRAFGSQLLSWCSRTPDCERCSCTRWNDWRYQQPAPSPMLTGRASSILLATGRICACSQCDWARYPPQLIQPELPVWDARMPSLAPNDRARCQAVEDLPSAMEVAKNSEIWVWGKPWLLYNPPSEKQLKTPAELPSPKTSL